jgi:putative ABC transport system substrate-binding protein
MRRRDVIACLLVGATVGRAQAQQTGKVYRIAILWPSSPPDRRVMAVLAANVAELERLGWQEGANLRIDRRFAVPDPAKIREIAAELVRLAPDAIETVGALATSIMHEATQKIPIVFWAVGEPVQLGLVSSMAHPGGNTTGLTIFGPAIGGKWVQILKEAAPRVLHAGYMFNPDTVTMLGYFSSSMTAAAGSLDVELAPTPVRDDGEIERAIVALAGEPGPGLIVLGDIFTYVHRARIAALAAEYRLPAIYPWKDAIDLGGMMSVRRQHS